MRKTLILAALAALAISPSFALASGTISAPVPVSASVASGCNANVPPLAFGAYDPLVANAAITGSDLPGSTTASVTCVKGTTASVSLSALSGTMAGGNPGDSLNYTLSLPSPGSQVSASVSSPLTWAIDGTIPKGQDPGVDSYSDHSISFVVNYTP